MNKRGIIAMTLGALMILGSFSLMAYNGWEERRASSFANEILPDLFEVIEEKKADSKQEEAKARPTAIVGGNELIGIITIPDIDLELPVLSTWSYPLLKIAPCRYSGENIDDPLVLAGHNYVKHFGKLNKLLPDDEVFFTDVEGKLTTYRVVKTEILQKTQVEDMLSENWDLSLFTCDYSGRVRLTVRCLVAD
ncbi:MAG TPA: sortase [Clostridiales bacterium]|jgi:sortase A|nr:sortase [Clostridiales bacterium]HRT82163.1 sortase [Oscillospiraceae bacterium]